MVNILIRISTWVTEIWFSFMLLQYSVHFSTYSPLFGKIVADLPSMSSLTSCYTTSEMIASMKACSFVSVEDEVTPEGSVTHPLRPHSCTQNCCCCCLNRNWSFTLHSSCLLLKVKVSTWLLPAQNLMVLYLFFQLRCWSDVQRL